MKFRVKFVLLVFGIVYLIIGILMLLYSAKVIERQDLINLAQRIDNVVSLNLLIGVVGAVLILLVVILINFVWYGAEAEKNIAFHTEHGEVLISLTAIEEYIKRLYRDDPEIKDMRARVSARKKGVLVSLKAVMLSERNLPAITERIQADLKRKLQEMLGVEEPITIRVYISKIAEKKEKEGKEEEPLPPYRKF